MSLSLVTTRAKRGIKAPEVSVEVHLSNGLPSLSIVGLPETTVKESKDRVRSALLNSLFEFPMRRITINLAPAEQIKEGSHFDLPIAIGILLASGQLNKKELSAFDFIGELALSGNLVPVNGVIPAVIAAKKAGRRLVLPAQNLNEAQLINSADILPVSSLSELCSILNGQSRVCIPPPKEEPVEPACRLDLSDVKGQKSTKRALEIAAAGGHHMLLFGPPGTGKTMLAKRLTSLLPALQESEAIELAAIRSVSGEPISAQNWCQRPFLSPHHTASGVALVGGGRPPKPGAISLAHRGVLFLDEILEFNRRDLEVLREPLECGEINISRANYQVTFPANFQLLAAMNPCPCGHYGNPDCDCRCTPDQIRRYISKLSGPLLDRIDLHIEVPTVARSALLKTSDREESSAAVADRVALAVERQRRRNGGVINSQLADSDLLAIGQVDQAALDFLERTIKKLKLSARVLSKVIKLSRTIADLAGSDAVLSAHVAEALSYRKLERLLAQL